MSAKRNLETVGCVKHTFHAGADPRSSGVLHTPDAMTVLIVASVSWAMLFTPASAAKPASGESLARAALKKLDVEKGVCAVLGLPDSAGPSFVTDLAKGSELLVYFQSPNADEVAGVRKAADAAGLLGRRIFVDQGDFKSVHLADNLADAVLVSSSAQAAVAEKELLRALQPRGKAIVGNRQIVKPFPPGVDAWSHPYHGPDNNPQSRDQLARAPYLTQFLAEPKFSPMPEVTVAAGGRIFKAMGHIAHKKNQNPMLNTLLSINAYNGTILWKRKLPEGFMIHRNTMIATPEALYLGDDQSCKVIDARTGRVKDQIIIPQSLSDGPVWKWMALKDGVLYALLGGEEVRVDVKPAKVSGLGHWPWGMWQGHDYKDPKTNFGFGRTLVAIDTNTKKILWNHREKEYIDSRGVCMGDGHIYFYSPQKFLACLDAKGGQLLWKNSDGDLLQAIGPDGKAQLWLTGYATSTFIKCSDDFIFFAGPQRKKLVAASTEDGKLVWQREHGNMLLVLRKEGIYAVGPQQHARTADQLGYKLAYETGEVLAELPRRRACTRATGSIDSIFYRASGGTVRLDIPSNTFQHIAPMRPPCQDGVIISDGQLYWGPWMCGCQLSFYGHICLAPGGEFHSRPPSDDHRLRVGPGDPQAVEKFSVNDDDWPSYQGDNARTSVTAVSVPRQVRLHWKSQASATAMPTAPVVAGGVTFVADRNGVVQAFAADGKPRWKAYTGGAVYFPPAVSQGRVFVGSADGRVYAFEAATGRRLWSFRLAPAERWISVYGKLISTWPVAGGVVVEDGVVYAAAGIAHYDSTHVAALDAVTGKPKWVNDSSGTLEKEANNGISLQGSLFISDGELRFLAGGVYETARYDLKTGRCLNQPKPGISSQFYTAFYPYYPAYGKYVSLDHTLADGRELSFDASYEGNLFSQLALLEPLPAGAIKEKKQASRWPSLRRRGKRSKRKALWQDKTGRRFTSFVVAPDVLLAAGHPAADGKPFLAAINTQDGSNIWKKELPADVVKGGTAVDHQGRIVVSLEDGQVLCFTGSAESKTSE